MNERVPPIVTEDAAPLIMFDIEKELRDHPYDPQRLEPIYKDIDRQIRNYDRIGELMPQFLRNLTPTTQSYGEYLAEHLEWTSRELSIFMVELGCDPDVAERIRLAFNRHDVGKVKQPGLWKITEQKQVFTDGEKRQRRLHAILGANFITTEYTKSGLRLTDDELMGIRVAKWFAAMHHERLNGTGPQGMKGASMCRVLRAATIIDTVHGKLKGQKSIHEIFAELEGEKHKGEFDPDLVEEYKSSYIRRHMKNDPVPALQP